MYDGYSRSRYNERSKRKKTNLILNILIAVVVLLIVVVAAGIFFGDDNEPTATPENTPSNETADESEEDSKDEEKPVTERDEDSSDNNVDQNKENEQQEQDEENQAGETGESEETGDGEETGESEQTAGSTVIETIIDPSWQPIGTVQEGEHITVFDGVDWDEMVAAISYATGLQKDNMTIKFLGNNGHNKSAGTVYSKNKEEIYKVYIEWVDGRGWKPTKVEVLSSIE